MQVQFLKNRNPDFFAAANVTGLQEANDTRNPTYTIISSPESIAGTTLNSDTIGFHIAENNTSSIYETDIAPGPKPTSIPEFKIIIPDVSAAPEALMNPILEAIIGSTPGPTVPNAGMNHTSQKQITDSTFPSPGKTAKRDAIPTNHESTEKGTTHTRPPSMVADIFLVEPMSDIPEALQNSKLRKLKSDWDRLIAKKWNSSSSSCLTAMENLSNPDITG